MSDRRDDYARRDESASRSLGCVPAGGQRSAQSAWLLVDDLRFPAGDSGTLKGSELGAQLWGTPEGTALLDFAANDPEVLAAFEGNWFPRWETRHILSYAVTLALADGRDPGEWADNAEAVLWTELRRKDVVGRAVAVVEGVVTPDAGISLPHGLAVLPAHDVFLNEFFARGWARYRTHLPSGQYSLLFAAVSVPRRLFSGGISGIWARIAVIRLRDAIWLATGKAPTIGHGVAWEDSPFPVSEPTHFDPDGAVEHRAQVIKPRRF